MALLPGGLRGCEFGAILRYKCQAMSGDACDRSRTRWHTRKIFCQCDLSHAQDFVDISNTNAYGEIQENLIFFLVHENEKN